MSQKGKWTLNLERTNKERTLNLIITLLREENTAIHMRAAVALLPVKKFKNIYPVKGTCGIVATSTPKKQANEDIGEGQITKEKADPIVAFSKPPPLPPVLGPLVALSLLETWSSRRDGNDD